MTDAPDGPAYGADDPEAPMGRVHLRGCASLQGLGLDCTCDKGTVDGIAGDAACRVCSLDNRNGTHDALQMTGHLSHNYDPAHTPDELPRMETVDSPVGRVVVADRVVVEEAREEPETGAYEGDDPALVEAVSRDQQGVELPPLSFAELRAVNVPRCARWHAVGEPWTGADWSNAFQGEAGEAGNVVKKLRRIETGTGSSRPEGDGTTGELIDKLAEEIADTIIYADLLANHYGIDIPSAIVAKFNRVSAEADFPERLAER